MKRALAFGALLVLMPCGAAAQSLEAHALPGAMPAEARAALEWLGAQTPANDAAREEHARNRMRVLHALAAADGEWMDSAAAQLDVMRRFESAPVTRAYTGALEMLRAKYALWPPRKLDHVRAGRRLLDEAVTAAGDDVEVRYLRLVSGHYLPFFLRDDEQVERDARALARLLPLHASRFPAPWGANLAAFVLDVVRLDATTAAPLRRMAEGT